MIVLATEQVSKPQNQARKILLIMTMVRQDMVRMNPSIVTMVLVLPSSLQHINLLCLEYFIIINH